MLALRTVVGVAGFVLAVLFLCFASKGCSVQCSRRLMRWLTMTGECCREVSDKSVVEMC